MEKYVVTVVFEVEGSEKDAEDLAHELEMYGKETTCVQVLNHTSVIE